MILYICYNNRSAKFLKDIQNYCSENFAELEIIPYDEDHFREKKHAYKIKGGYSARMTPFMLLLDDNKYYVKAFYSEDKGCTLDNFKTFVENNNLNK